MRRVLPRPHFHITTNTFPIITEKKLRKMENSCIKKAEREQRNRNMWTNKSMFNTVPWKKQCNQWAMMCLFMSLLMEIESACGVFLLIGLMCFLFLSL